VIAWLKGYAQGINAGNGKLLGLIALALTLCLAHSAEPGGKAQAPTVGMEGVLEVTLPGTLLEAKPVDGKGHLIVRIAATRPHGTLTWYDLRYIGLVPGGYDLRSCLVRKDGSTADDLPPLEVRINGLLPESHKGELVPEPRSIMRFFGGYRGLIIAAGVLWMAALFPLIFMGRRGRKHAEVVGSTPEPTIAERLKPLVEKAAAGDLTTAGKAHLERLLLSYWRDRLHLADLGPGEAIVALREHPEAGVLLRALEDWLHRPPGVAHVDIQALLEPYRRPAEIAIVGSQSTYNP
jgi:hypothetical protein